MSVTPTPTRRRRDELGTIPTSTSRSATLCTPFALPSDGIIVLGLSSTITLTADALITPACTVDPSSIKNDDPSDVVDMQDPFHSSVVPQVYATGAATVIAWMLVIMLLITPRTFFVGGAGGRSGLLGRRGMISGASGGSSVIGVGSRPWLQKVAALTVAISMTIATADTFNVAEQQYEAGYMDATAIRERVVGGLEVKISRVISDMFLLLAQVQTLIRLFPRHKEKVIIKWVGFGLIILDVIFSSVNNFMGHDIGRPKEFKDAIPALAYLFELALSMLYAAWIIYYAFTKRRYAFYHPLMYNISLIATLSCMSILTPVVFFATDISNYSVAGWGDYFRWVGSAAASVIVWEWVERIEALEREDKKDGILGREIFDGDEMLDVTPSAEINWPGAHHSRNKNSQNRRDKGSGGGSSGAYSSGAGGQDSSRFAHRSGNSRICRDQDGNFVRLRSMPSRSNTQQTGTSESPALPVASGPTPPAAIATPVSRTDTISAASTAYAVRYHNTNSPLPHFARRRSSGEHIRFDLEPRHERIDNPEDDDATQSSEPSIDLETQASQPRDNFLYRSMPFWQVLSAIGNPFKKAGKTPPPEILGARVIEPVNNEEPVPRIAHNYSRWDFKGRLGALAADASERIRERAGNRTGDEDLPVHVIPAQPRGGRAWSPDALKALTTNPLSAPRPTTYHSQDHHGMGEGNRVVNSSLPTPMPSPSISRMRSPLSISTTPSFSSGDDDATAGPSQTVSQRVHEPDHTASPPGASHTGRPTQ
ncbi:PalH-domain-containing protein [Saccharata proteae CBS 121410]|uniref:PalH-domain-containing protein n=1 Tax=Saccharata proteae CBS 121410 TaxID=1314787 RepID=A0A9P4LVS4_9PEZI|nr:PalH-domain-containing protein [Saccharata proteae CBS 121410]